jgi:DNA-binding response OmpR family regulator
MSRILIVEDETNLRASLAEYLQLEGFEISEAASLSESQTEIVKQADIIILDWMLPGIHGIELMKIWRSQGIRVPVIFLTARASLIDKVLGLEMGASDYVTKPFEPRELLARIRVHLRSTEPTTDNAEIVQGGIRVNRMTREVFFRHSRVELKKMEFSLLLLLIEHPNQVFSRDEILNRVWGYESFPTTRTIDTHILQLRQKFDWNLFETVRGIGYRLKVSDDDQFSVR